VKKRFGGGKIAISKIFTRLNAIKKNHVHLQFWNFLKKQEVQ